MFSSLNPADLALAAAIFCGFVGGIFLLRIVLPGKIHEGQKLRDGTRKTYKLNGLRILIVLAASIAAGQALHLFTLSTVTRLFWPLFVIANLFAIVHSVQLYLTGRDKRSGPPRGLLKDFAMGIELNPAFAGVDLKMFAYLPSLMGLWVINLSFAVTQYEALGHLTTRMWLYQSFFTLYIFNYYEFEYGMLHTWDVIAEDFGLMLVWGDYVLVPFFYSICGWWLVGSTAPIEPYETVALVILFAVGFVVFRGANQQKHDYKEHPERPIWGKTPETVGGRLLVSGFWGIGRKLNYTGELMVYFAWTLTTGFQSIVPYILPLWLLCLFSHRAWRDDKKCRDKYGPLWAEYCARARFRMIPFLY
jgi:delta14-sterol reductase